MKVLHVSFADSGGGAGRAAGRLHRAERRLGIESRMLVAQRLTDDPAVVHAGRLFPGRNALSWQLEQRLLRRAPDSGSIERALNLVPSGLHRRINASDADVVHLHWINGGMISVPEIGKIRKPLVWTLHDMWPFAGAEHYTADGDRRWRTGYSTDTLDGRTWNRKRRHWRKIDPVIVAPSRWMADCSRASALFRQHRVRVIPNPVDPSEFQPRDKAAARAALNLPHDRRIVLFGAHDAGSGRKGFDLLRAALAALTPPTDESVDVVVFGSPPADASFPLRTRVLGWVNADLDLLYSAADVLVAPSRIDNLPNTVAEAAACGLPSVAFRVGGLPDLITHRRTGYLAEPFDPGDLAAGIRWALAQDGNRISQAVCEEARLRMPEPVVAAYVDAYEEAIARPRLRPAPLERLGSAYGGWTVPAGMLRRGDVCYSAGVGEDITFDLELIRRFGCQVFAYDPTPRAAAHVEASAPAPPAFNFASVGVWDANVAMPFFAPANPQHVSHSIVNIHGTRDSFTAPCRRLAVLMAENGHAAIDLLKLDVEGAEYRIIDSLLDDGVAVRILCVEFHQHRGDRAGDYRRVRAAAIATLRRAGFRLISSEGQQYTFVYQP